MVSSVDKFHMTTLGDSIHLILMIERCFIIGIGLFYSGSRTITLGERRIWYEKENQGNPEIRSHIWLLW